jgi:hypothetical protein
MLSRGGSGTKTSLPYGSGVCRNKILQVTVVLFVVVVVLLKELEVVEVGVPNRYNECKIMLL